MMKKVYNHISMFDKYFKEADGDEGQDSNVSVRVTPRKNRGTDYGEDDNVRVTPRKNRGTDYGEDDENDDTTSDEQNNDDAGNDQDTNDENEDGSDATTNPTEYGDADDADESNNDENTTVDSTEDGDADDADESNSDPTDYSDEDNSDDDSGDDTSDNSDSESDDNSDDNNNDDAQKKFYTYKRFLRLYNVLESFIEKIQKVVKNDPIENTVLKTVTNNLIDLHDNMYDYMTLKYESSSYVQILIYFETSISIIKLNFELLKNNKINLKQ